MFVGLLDKKLSIRDIRAVCNYVRSDAGGTAREMLYSFVDDQDIRAGYNALWCLSHFDARELAWLEDKRNDLIDKLLIETHSGKKRLMMTLLDRMPASGAEFRSDYLDFCLSNIISSEPVSIRSLCIKQAYAQCRCYPELLSELKATIDLLDMWQISPGLRSSARHIIRLIEKSRHGAC